MYGGYLLDSVRRQSWLLPIFFPCNITLVLYVDKINIMKNIYWTLVERTAQLEIGMKCTTKAEVQKVPAKQLSIGSIFDWNSFTLIVNVPQI